MSWRAADLTVRAGLLVCLALTGCGAPAPAAPAPPAAAVSQDEAVQEKGYNLADIVFLQQMIGHHDLAGQLADVAVKRATSPAVRQLAQTVQAECRDEVRRMSTVLTSLGIGPDAIASGHTHGGGPSPADIAALASASGSDVDRRFVDLMTSHSLGATQLANAEAKEGSNTSLLKFAAGIAKRESDRTVALATLN